ncbi:hypothetical protein NURINAE_00687 [Candidatus Nitrosacidococcus sp. I8]|nr:hypothetical protein NURINAE_00687 [Candidatus Nitrosacidococcus sp. I8]
MVVRNLIPNQVLDEANSAFDAEAISSNRFIYRQATANPERHIFTQHGFMLNSILNPQSLNPRYFSKFRQSAEKILTHQFMQKLLNIIFSEQGKCVQGMYFHGNPATWAHQDTYYLDSEHIGTMVGAWIATEDITLDAW